MAPVKTKGSLRVEREGEGGREGGKVGGGEMKRWWCLVSPTSRNMDALMLLCHLYSQGRNVKCGPQSEKVRTRGNARSAGSGRVWMNVRACEGRSLFFFGGGLSHVPVAISHRWRQRCPIVEAVAHPGAQRRQSDHNRDAVHPLRLHHSAGQTGIGNVESVILQFESG